MDNEYEPVDLLKWYVSSTGYPGYHVQVIQHSGETSEMFMDRLKEKIAELEAMRSRYVLMVEKTRKTKSKDDKTALEELGL